jgi:hypothetical protein
MDRLPSLPYGLEWSGVLWTLAIFLISFTVSLTAIGLLVILLPPRFFLESEDRRLWVDRHPAVRWLAIACKNLLGLLLVLVGLGLSIPGIPGQGLLTVLVGIVLLDFPGKRRLERKIVGRPRVLRALNRLRARFRRPPLVVSESGVESVESRTPKGFGE